MAVKMIGRNETRWGGVKRGGLPICARGPAPVEVNSCAAARVVLSAFNTRWPMMIPVACCISWGCVCSETIPGRGNNTCVFAENGRGSWDDNGRLQLENLGIVQLENLGIVQTLPDSSQRLMEGAVEKRTLQVPHCSFIFPGSKRVVLISAPLKQLIV